MKTTKTTIDSEIEAIAAVHSALKELDPAARSRVIDYVIRMLDIQVSGGRRDTEEDIVLAPAPSPDEEAARVPSKQSASDETQAREAADDGISQAGRKLITRSGIKVDQLGAIFSVGGDEIDVISTKVPGKSARQRMRSVFLLKGVAAYLATGAARFTDQQARDACSHYNAMNESNYATYLKELAAEVSGSRATGYTLTPRGLSGALELIKEMLGAPKTRT